MVEVESHPFEPDTVLFMDWRDDHFDNHPDMKAANQYVTCTLPAHVKAQPIRRPAACSAHCPRDRTWGISTYMHSMPEVVQTLCQAHSRACVHAYRGVATPRVLWVVQGSGAC